jgi:hypothetical protein
VAPPMQRCPQVGIADDRLRQLPFGVPARSDSYSCGCSATWQYASRTLSSNVAVSTMAMARLLSGDRTLGPYDERRSPCFAVLHLLPGRTGRRRLTREL